MVWWVLGIACRKDETEPPSDSVPSSAETGTPPPATGTTGTTADTGPDTVPLDCEGLSASPVSMALVEGARGYHGVVFDDLGHVIGNDENAIIQADYYGNASVLVPGVGVLQDLERLNDGDYAAAAFFDGVFRFGATGAWSPISGLTGIYGLAVGPDGSIFVAGESAGLVRLDPVTGEQTALPDLPFAAKAIHFSGDWTRLYLGSDHAGTGEVWVLPMDPVTLVPTGPPTVLATLPGTPHDCIVTDACGNVYVCDFGSLAMFRITPDGEFTKYLDLGRDGYVHGAEWGSGIGGFRVDALYVSQPFGGDTITEVVVGVPGSRWDGTPF